MKQRTKITARFALLAALLISTAPQAASNHADVELALELLAEQQSKRYEDVEILVEKVQHQGLNLGLDETGSCASAGCLAYKKEVIEGADGQPQHVLRPLTENEIAVIAGLSMDSAAMKVYGQTMKMMQTQLTESMKSAASNGLGGPMLGMMTDQMGSKEGQTGSAAFANPMTMFDLGGDFALQAGSSIDNAVDALLQGKDTAQQEELGRRGMMQNGVMGSVEQVGGVAAQSILFNNINEVVTSDEGDEFVMNSAKIWVGVDNGELVGHRIDGTAQERGGSRQFFIESFKSDFKEVPGSDLAWPHKSTSRMGGIMTPKEQEQLKEAQVQLEEFDAQMAAMPANQRKMMENMMGGQLDSLRSMASDGVMQHVRVIEQIYINPDLKELYSAAPGVGDLNMPLAGEGNIVQRVQLDLVTLGYDPGNISGEMTTGTAITISQYQAERGMPVTGEASQELAEALTAEIMSR